MLAESAFENSEHSAQVPGECEDEFDCQRVVQGGGGRNLPPYWDEFKNPLGPAAGGNYAQFGRDCVARHSLFRCARTLYR